MKDFTDTILQKIEDYVMDRLDATERTLFETELATDTDLREEVAVTSRVKATAQRSQLRDKIKTIQTQKLAEWDREPADATRNYLDETPVRRVNWLGRSATFAAAACVLFVAYLSFSSVSLPDAATVSERGNATTDSLQVAIYGQYAQAIAALENEDFDTAIVLFDQVATQENIRPYYKEAAVWYGGVARIKSDPKTARILTNYVIKKEDKEFTVSTVDQWKAWVQIKMSQIF